MRKNQIVIIAFILALIIGGFIYFISLPKEKTQLEKGKFEGESFTTQGEGK